MRDEIKAASRIQKSGVRRKEEAPRCASEPFILTSGFWLLTSAVHPSSLLQSRDPFRDLALFIFRQFVSVRPHGRLKPVSRRVVEQRDDVFDCPAWFRADADEFGEFLRALPARAVTRGATEDIRFRRRA